MTKRLVASALMAGWLLAFGGAARAAESAVVLLYHRFDDDRIPALNTTGDQLAAHMAELKSGGFTVLPLDEIVRAMHDGRPLPDKAVAITVDDLSAGFVTEAWPQFRRAGVPVTLFVATDEIDRGDTLTWAQVRAMAADGLAIGSQGAARLRLPRVGAEAATADLARANARFEREVGRVPSVFAWPGGEASAEAARLVAAAGHQAAFGQHSGALWPKADPFFLPRFPLAAAYGEPERFRLAARALPLPATDITPADPRLAVNPPAFGFTLAEEVPGIAGLACFAAHEGQVRVEQLGPRIEVRMSRPIPAGRGRINCTVPTLDGRWRWFGWQFLVP